MNLKTLLEQHSNDVLSFDVETASDDSLLGFGIAWGTEYEESAYFKANDPVVQANLHLLKREFVTHYGQYDAKIMLKQGVRIRIGFDTYSAARLILYERREGFGLKPLCFEFFNLEWGNVADLIKEYGSLELCPPHIIAEYCRRDCCNTLRLRNMFLHMAGPKSYLLGIESKMNHALAHMEAVGIGFDARYMDEIKSTIDAEMKELDEKIRAYIPTVQLGSNDNIAACMFTNPDGMLLSTEGLPRTPKTKRVSVKGDTFEMYKDRHPLFALIADWKALDKLRNTYTDSYAKAAAGGDHRIHSSFNSFGANTGRLSSSGPNLQNIPNASHGIIIRKAFVAREGYTLVSLDLKQIELLILAAFSRDETMMRYFREGRDIHRLVASRMYNVTEEEVTKMMRASVKSLNFGKIYGGGLWLFTPFVQHLPKSEQDAAMKMLEAKWYSIFPGVKAYHAKHWTPAYQSRGYNQTWFGRRRMLHKLPPTATGSARAGLLRLLINGDIQGTAGDIHKIGMVLVDELLEQYNEQERVKGNYFPAGNMVNVIHDELLLEIRTDLLDTILPLVIQTLKLPIPTFPLEIGVDVEVGKNWFEMEPYEQ